MKTRLLALALMLGVVAAAPSASAAGSPDTRQGAFPISWTQCPDRPEDRPVSAVPRRTSGFGVPGALTMRAVDRIYETAGLARRGTASTNEAD